MIPIFIFSKRPNIISSNCICEIFIQHSNVLITPSNTTGKVQFPYIEKYQCDLHCMLDYPNIFLADGGGKKEINIRIARADETMRSVKI